MTGGHMYKMFPESPIGCRGAYNVTNCAITWNVESSDGCTATLDPHPLCGLSALGLGPAELRSQDYYWSTWKTVLRQKINQYEYNYTNESYYYMDTFIGNNIVVPKNDTKYIGRAHFDPAEFSGHPVWNGYTLPDISVSLIFLMFCLR